MSSRHTAYRIGGVGAADEADDAVVNSGRQALHRHGCRIPARDGRSRGGPLRRKSDGTRSNVVGESPRAEDPMIDPTGADDDGPPDAMRLGSKKNEALH
jgi:hypothetical protein